MRTAIVTGSCGLVGSAAAKRLLAEGWSVLGVDNDMRSAFFGKSASTTPAKPVHKEYAHFSADVCDSGFIDNLVKAARPQLVVHAAAQPSHDYAADHPLLDFRVNAVATVELLEACRQYASGAVFVFLSTNKVYGDWPNATPDVCAGEMVPVDQCNHSLFGCSKLAADVYVQEYGRRYGMRTCALRCGCLTGAAHAGVEQHGFLSHLVRTQVAGAKYKVIGWGGLQVRDNLHADDLADLIAMIALDPPPAGRVFNVGGGKENACSVLEALELVSKLTGRPANYEIVAMSRYGDHFKYVTDLTRVKKQYPEWEVRRSLLYIIKEIYDACKGGQK